MTADNASERDELLLKLTAVHRGWCNYCNGSESVCIQSPSGGCSLRDYLAATPARDELIERIVEKYYPFTHGSGNNDMHFTIKAILREYAASAHAEPNAAQQENGREQSRADRVRESVETVTVPAVAAPTEGN